MLHGSGPPELDEPLDPRQDAGAHREEERIDHAVGEVRDDDPAAAGREIFAAVDADFAEAGFEPEPKERADEAVDRGHGASHEGSRSRIPRPIAPEPLTLRRPPWYKAARPSGKRA